jgi:hypothetical protein
MPQALKRMCIVRQLVQLYGATQSKSVWLSLGLGELRLPLPMSEWQLQPAISRCIGTRIAQNSVTGGSVI